VAFPSIRSSISTSGATAATNPVVNLPATIDAGDTLLVAIRSASTTAFTWPAGWTEVVDSQADASDDTLGIAWRKADGTEDGGTVTVTGTVSGRFAALAWAIQDAADPTVTAPTVSTVASGFAITADPPSLNAGSAKDYLWFSIGSAEGENTFSSYSANYTLGQLNNNSGAAGSVALNARIAGSARQLNIQTEDPGVVTWTGADDQWMAVTVAVHPAPPTGFKDAVFRTKVRATVWKDAVARIRSAVRAYRDAVVRTSVDIRGFRDATARLRSAATAYRDANARVTSAIQAFRDAAVRIAVESGATTVYRDAVSRVRLRLSQSASPNIDELRTGWTTNAGGTSTLWGRVNEVVRDDSDYIQSTASPTNDTIIFGFTDLQDPGDNNGLRLRLAIGKNTAGGDTINLAVTLRAGLTDIATRNFNDLSSDISEVSVLYTSAEVDDFRATGGFATAGVKIVASSS
jgi:hypothetical protein